MNYLHPKLHLAITIEYTWIFIIKFFMKLANVNYPNRNNETGL